MGNGPFKAKTKLSQTRVKGGVRAEKGADPALNTSHCPHGDAFFLLLLTGHTMANIGADCPWPVEMQLWAGTSPALRLQGRKVTFSKETSPGLQVSTTVPCFYETCTLPWWNYWFLLILEPTPEQN